MLRGPVCRFIATVATVAMATTPLGCTCSEPKESTGDGGTSAPAHADQSAEAPSLEGEGKAADEFVPERPAKKPEELSPPPIQPPAEARPIAGGGYMEVLSKGNGETVGPTDIVVADISIWSKVGDLVESSLTTETVTNFEMKMLGPELKKAMASLGPGAKARLWLTPQHTERFAPHYWPTEGVIIEIEVFHRIKGNPDQVPPSSGVGVSKPDAPLPSGAGEPPAGAKTTKMGLKYAIVRAGAGTQPTPDKSVVVEVNGWQLGLKPEQVLGEEKMILELATAPGGLSEILTQAKTGGLTRIWVPPELAGAVLPGRENSQLVLDIYLRGIQ